MNDQRQLSDEQVQLATSRTLGADSSLDADTAAAREAFLALGAAAESAASPFDQAALARHIAQACPTTAERLVDPERRTPKWWLLIASGAIATGMFIAVTRIATEQPPDTAATAGTAAVVKNSAPPAAGAVALAQSAWSDPLDDEIALAAATIQQFSVTSGGVDGLLLDMNEQLESLSRELRGETL